MGFYIETTQTPNQGGFAAEDIPAGTAVVVADGEVTLFDAATDEVFSGVADTPRRGEYIASYDHESGTYTYLANITDDYDRDNHAPLGFQGYDGVGDTRDAHLVPVGGGDDGDLIKLRTITDTNATAPSISDGTVVGVVDSTDADAPDNAAGYIVEEGYSYDGDGDTTPTTFSRANDNFVAIGKAYKPEDMVAPSDDGTITEYDFPVRIKVNKGL